MKNFIQRLASAVVLIAVVLGGIWWLPTPLFALLSLPVILLAAWEWALILRLPSPQRWALLLALLVLCGVAWLLPEQRLWLGAALGGLGLGLSLLWTWGYFHNWSQTPVYCLGAVALLSCFWIVLVAGQQHAKLDLIVFLCLVWLADIAAYVGGKTMGKRKLMPAISPGKTWEGLLTSLLACLVFIAFFDLGLWGVLIWAAAVWGDAAESVLKRDRKVKDSGNLIPGHGGVLDRIDALLMAAVAWNIYLLVVG